MDPHIERAAFQSNDEVGAWMNGGHRRHLDGVEDAEDVELSFLRQIRRVGKQRKGDVHDETYDVAARRARGITLAAAATSTRGRLAFGMAVGTRDVVPANNIARGTAESPWVTEALLVLMAVIWGVNFSVLKYGTHVVTPLAFNGIRIPLAAAAQLVVARMMRLPRPAPSDAKRLILLGILGNGLYQVLFILGVASSRVATAALVIAATPAFIAMLGRLRGSEHLAGRNWLGIACQVVGVGVVVLATARGTTDATGDRDSLIGGALVLGAALSWSIYSVILKGLSDRVHPLQIGGYTMLGGAAVLLVVGFPALLDTRWSALPGRFWGALAYSAIIAMVFAYLFYYRGLRLLGPTHTAMYSNMQPLIAMLVAWIALREVPTNPQWAGAAMIVGGLLLTRLTPSMSAPAPAEP
jgi:drug/metabolite transporter (DMT)-like permease